MKTATNPATHPNRDQVGHRLWGAVPLFGWEARQRAQIVGDEIVSPVQGWAE